MLAHARRSFEVRSSLCKIWINMETLIVILAVLAGVIGIAGSILPALPGTSFSWIGLFLLYMWGPEAVPVKVLIIWE